MDSVVGEAITSGHKKNPPPLSSLRNPTFDFLHSNYKKSELQKFCSQLQLGGIWTTKEKLIEKLIVHFSTSNRSPSSRQSTAEDIYDRDNEGVSDLIERFELFMRETNDNFYVVNNSLAEKEREINELKTKLFLAEETNRSLQEELGNKKQDNNEDEISTKKILLIGDSCLQEVRNTDLQDDVIIRTLPDANMAMLRSWIDEKLTHSLKECIICCGMQDLLEVETTPEEAINHLETLVANLKENSEDIKIKVCELVPSLKSEEIADKINQFNAKLEEWSSTNGVVFVKTNEYFKLGTGETDLLCYENADKLDYDILSRVGATRLLDAISSKSESKFVCNNWRIIKQKLVGGSNSRKTSAIQNNGGDGDNMVSSHVVNRRRSTYQNMKYYSNRGNDNRHYNARSSNNWNEHGHERDRTMRGQVNSRSKYDHKYNIATVRNRINRTGCYNCGEFNHVQSNCRYDHKIKCNICHEYGHKSKLCGNNRH